ncbi:cell division protein ZipA C-terminal FtsZ-binding domain-containing protein [Algiphilus aromaticivorans]|uniref:cell division protein ZipA C-terminal FtsZ-binding domain-containing protein n=1 Tax=Algiphilus aromaticivorans TaxID=382454 RepID=UPI000694C973|nr:cell division protein ZipA C-terminal FtsZ-binding domain-containing protein [Algiphilus aromaticivorans]
MTALQLSLLIFALVAIAVVGFVSYRRNEAPRERKAPRVDGGGGEEQLDLLKSQRAAGGFDEFGVGEPRSVGGKRRAAQAPEADTAPAPASAPVPEPRPVPEIEPEPEPVAESPAPKKDAGPAPAQDDYIVSLFLVQSEGQPIAGPAIHRCLHGLGLEPGERLTYERRVNGTTWFHVANMRKPGYLDPGEADRFETPGLSLFALLDGQDDPLAVIDDVLATAGRIAESLDAVLLDEQRRPLDAEAAQRLRNDVLDWHKRRA